MLCRTDQPHAGRGDRVPPGDPLGRISLRRSRALEEKQNKRKRQLKEALVQEPEKKDKKRKASMAKKLKKGGVIAPKPGVKEGSKEDSKPEAQG